MTVAFLREQYSPRALIIWFLSCVLAGVLLVLAIPISPPGGYVENVQKIFLNLNFADLFSSGARSFLVVIMLGSLLGAVLFVASAALAAWEPPVGKQMRSRFTWVIYALPMLAAWGIYLLAFWPAMMSPDSIDTWTQAQTLHFNNGHPLLYVLITWMLTRLWNFPTIVVVAQMLALSLLVAWGLGELRRCGLPGWAAWLVALLFALSPQNGALTVTLWKDIPYSTAVFALSILVLLIVLDPERWLAKRGLWVMLGFAAILSGLLRYNGVVIAPVLFLLLALLYRKHWAVFARALALFLVAWWLVSGPLTALLHVQKTSIVSGSMPMHHIAAHIHAGSQLSPGDQAIIEQIMPLDQWHYYCYLANPILFNPALNLRAAQAHSSDLFWISLRLFLQHPTVDINHTFCASSLIYRVLPPFDGYLYGAAFAPGKDGRTIYLEPNAFNIQEASVLPELNRWLTSLLEDTRKGETSWLVWRPALYLYLFLFSGAVFALRLRSWKAAAFLLPGIIHSATLFAVNISQAFRYQYPIFLLCLFSIALLFLPRRKET